MAQKKILVICRGREAREIKSILAQIAIPFDFAFTATDIKRKIRRGDVACALFDNDAFSGGLDSKRLDFLKILRTSGKSFIFLSSSSSFCLAEEAESFGASEIVIRPYNYRELILRINSCYHKKVRITCMGGGTGLFNLLMGLKKLPHVLINSIVAMSDDGGSTGKLRESFGMLPPGDVRRSLVALSNAPLLMN
ncbi:MAG: 2-phospho-L-lactate transferase CofD family protein, partial [Candidatus Omnitrophica bacterium]|nr:2-phospho-L-lactate transferase CofD family protein [Candidatus Omnitrophota bacterium]